MVQLTETGVRKVREILGAEEPKPAGLRIAVVGGGCSGFRYSMAFENAPGMLDKTYDFGGLNVFIDQASLLYLDGVQVDYVETLEGSGFKFDHPNVKCTCGCGSSFIAYRLTQGPKQLPFFAKFKLRPPSAPLWLSPL